MGKEAEKTFREIFGRPPTPELVRRMEGCLPCYDAATQAELSALLEELRRERPDFLFSLSGFRREAEKTTPEIL